ncbi:MAG TPA: TonB-dependent receptor [Cyclobacteriaceae bacterium]|nr:TonB-dependent receptor [Cyclobacteriaceae bacterium]
MVRNCLLLLLIVGFYTDLHAQSRTINGYVRDQANGESLIGATIVDTKRGKGTTSNTFGFYSLSVPGDSVVLSYSFVGYSSKRISLRVKNDTSIIVTLQGGRLLDEVTVTGERAEKIHETSRTGTVNLPVTQIKKVPTFAGEQDVLKALQLLPGVSGGNEGSSNILVRGGTPDQTLVLMDGVPIYNPTHVYGLFSSFNPDAVNNVELVKSGFPARYGGRLSGIADITLREGNSNRFSAQATAGVLASRIVLEGPIAKGRTSFLVSGRASYLTIMKPYLADIVGSIDGYSFYDINAKINHRFNSKNRLYASFYNGGDHMALADSFSSTDSIKGEEATVTSKFRDVMEWNNLVTSLRWNHEINATRFFNVTAYVSNYNLTIENQSSRHTDFQPSGRSENLEYRYKYLSRINDVGIKIDFDHIPNTKHYIRYGAALIRHEFDPGIGAAAGTDSLVTAVAKNSLAITTEANAYIEDDVNITSQLKMNAGLHTVMYGVSGKTYAGIQPRLSLRYALPNNIAVKASYSYMQQFLQTLVSTGMGMPTELWVPVTDKLKPQNSQQVSLGVAQTIKHDIEISVEGFHKTMNNLLEYEEGTSYMDNDKPWYDKVESGRGKSYGVEVFVQKKVGRLTGFLGYTLSWNKRQFDNINNGEWYYYRFDRRHDFKSTANFQLNKHWDFSVTWIYGTGNAVTVPMSIYAANFPSPTSYRNGVPNADEGFWATEYTSRGNYRMRPYHRLDFNVNYSFTTRAFEHRIALGCYNTYNRANPFYLQYTVDNRRFNQVTLFPILPSLSYSIKF